MMSMPLQIHRPLLRTALAAALAVSAHAHYIAIHGGAVGGDPERCLCAQAFAVLGSDLQISDEARRLILQGSCDEDANWVSTFDHFYNPHTGLNTYPNARTTALESAAWHWGEAIRLHRAGALRGPEGAWHRLGETLHLLQDMTSPAHIHDDVHFLYVDTDDFERAALELFPTPDQMTALGLVPVIPSGEITLASGEIVSGDSIEGFVQHLAEFTHRLTSYQGELVAAEGEQPDSELRRMFPSLHWNPEASTWAIDGVGLFDPSAEKNGWCPCQGDHTVEPASADTPMRIAGLFYIENIEDARPVVFERPLTHAEFTAGMTLNEIWSLELYPEAVQRSAGLIQVFLREIESEPSGD